MEYIGPFEVPNLSSNLSTAEALRALIPHGFNDIVHVEEGKECLVLRFPHAEDHSAELTLTQKLYNPSGFNTTFPKFCLQISEFVNRKIDYFDDSKDYMLNQNQIIWLLLHHRFTMYRENNVHFTNLITTDLGRLMDYGEYNTYCSTNAIKKSQNTVTIINCWDRDPDDSEGIIWKRKKNSSGEWVSNPIGEFLMPPALDKKQLRALFRDLPIQAGSESMASESAKFVVYDHRKPLYNSVGYGVFFRKCPNLLKQHKWDAQRLASQGLPVPDTLDGKYSIIKSIFPSKANVPARFKSHIVADAFKFARPSAPIFKQDIVDMDSMSTDGTMIDALVVFDHMDPITGRLVCGEIEASNKFSSMLVHKDETVRGVFKVLNVEVGKVYTGDNILLGVDEEDEPYILRGNKSVEIVSIEENAVSDSYKIVVRCVRQIGSGRIFSHTGLKGVTKPKPDLGKVYAEMPDGTTKAMNVDLVTGMNAVKAKKNTILLAQAAFMFKANQCGDMPYLDSMNENEINQVCSKIGKVKWVDQDGNEKDRYAGIVQVSVNELSYMFNNVKPQKFMPESGRYLYHGGQKELFEQIWKNGVDQDEKEAVLEFQKILSDDVGYTAAQEGIPIFTPRSLREHKVFDLTDLKYERKPVFPYESKILDEEYNKGFCIDLRYRGGGIIRFPSAKTLNLFVSNLAGGDWIYPQLLVNISKCIRCCIELKADGQPDIGFLNDKNGKKRREIDYYLTQIRKVLHHPINLASSLLKPKIKGVGMKQMVDMYVPQGTIVIMDNRTHKLLKQEAETNSEPTGLTLDEEGNLVQDVAEKREELFKSLCIRNPVVWKLQVQSLTIWNKDQFREHLAGYGIDLSNYLITRYCREILFMNPEDAIYQQSDVDGDLMPVYVPSGNRVQELLRTFGSIEGKKVTGVDGIVPKELMWTQRYRDGEIGADLDLNIDGGYQLHCLSMSYHPYNEGTFDSYFINSIVAKGDVGLATHNNWTVQSLIEIFRKRCDDGLVVDPRRPESKLLVSMTMEEANEVLSMYSRLVQDFVIRGIKHNAGGSSGFEPFLLENINKPEFNADVRDTLKKSPEEGGLGIDKTIIDKFFTMVAWGESTGMSKSVMQFISIHNKGKQPNSAINYDQFDEIVEDTFYGKLVEPLYDITKEVEHAKANGHSLASNDAFVRTLDIPAYA